MLVFSLSVVLLALIFVGIIGYFTGRPSDQLIDLDLSQSVSRIITMVSIGSILLVIIVLGV